MGRGMVVMGAVAGACLMGLSPAEADEIAELRAQVQQVQRENAALQEQLAKQQQATQRLLQKVEALERQDQALSEEIGSMTEEQAPGPWVKRKGEPLELQIGRLPKVTVIGFGNIGFTALHEQASDEQGFFIGAQDFTVTSSLTDRLGFLLEADFHMHAQPFDPFDDFNHLHLERALLRYAFSDLLKLTAGKMHQALGYYNQTYHHGSYLETAMFRPEIVEFEVGDVLVDRRSGGHLPIHATGVEFAGTYGFPELADVEYALSVSNGRSPLPAFVEDNRNTNDTLGLLTRLTIKPTALIEGLQVGVTYYLDKIPARVEPFPAPTRTGEITEEIFGAHVVYLDEKTELIAELYDIHQWDKGIDARTDDWGGFVQAAYQIAPKLRPYFRFDYMDTDASRFFQGERWRKDNTYSLGVRWDAMDWNAIKLEYRYRDEQAVGPDDQHTVTMNTVYMF